MKQALLQRGKVMIEEVPAPTQERNSLLVEVGRSLISTGTEVSSVLSSDASLLQKLRNQPGTVGKAMESVRVRGLVKTFARAREQMSQSSPLGYSCSGRVLGVGESVQGFQAGDRVACAGAGLANHAEIVSVPANLCVRVPDDVSDREAAFVTVGAIALQGVRRADVRLGETVGVLGLGLIGQLTVQLLAAAGCRVVGMDLDRLRVELALKHGMSKGANTIEEMTKNVFLMTGQKGVDVTILTASTASSEPTQLAFQLTRKKGRIVVVGAVGLELKRSPFYEKEQDFLISCSYGPGRYDLSYEKEGHDYPYAYVRWTENRNMAAFLDLIQQKKLQVESLIDREVSLDQVTESYQELAREGAMKPLAVVITYPEPEPGRSKLAPLVRTAFSPPARNGRIRLGLIGVGSFAKSTHLPNIESLKSQLQVVGVCTASGATAATVGRQLKASLISNDYREMLDAPEVDAVLVSTRHGNHAEIAAAAIRAGKHVYLEKPLALTLEQLESLDQTIQSVGMSTVFMVGFNRRYSAIAERLFTLCARRTTPLLISYRVNAGALPENHWSLTEEGGGRLRGEACHMADFFSYLVNHPLEECDVFSLRSQPCYLRPDENFVSRFRYADGSVCTLVYTANGSRELAKERIELHWDGNSAVLDDFRSLALFGCQGNLMLPKQDKGHGRALTTFVSAINEGICFPTPWERLYETTKATILLDRQVWGRPQI